MVAIAVKVRRRVKSLLIGSLVPLTIFSTLLKTSGYPYLSPEVFLAFAVILVLGIALGAIILISPLAIKVAIYAVLIALAANALLRPFPTLEWFSVEESVYSLAIFCTALLVIVILRRKIDEILCVVFIALFISSFFIPSRPSAWTREVQDTTFIEDTSLPPYIHIVLDGHIGLEGVPKVFDPSGNFKNAIAKIYIDLGYKVYGNVFVTTPPRTILSFRNFLNFVHENDAQDINTFRDKGQNFNFVAGTNRLFSYLEATEYAINVIQSTHLDLCKSSDLDFRVATCRTYPFSRFYDSLIGSRLGTTDKAKILVNVLFQRSGIAPMINRAAESGFGQKVGFPNWPIDVCLYCISAFTALDEFDATIHEIKRGNAYFIHLMAPHDPYQFYNENCEMIFPLDFHDGSVASSFPRYLGQATCTQHRLRETLVKLSEYEASSEAVIIIHGDHGPAAYSLNVKDVPFDSHSRDYGQAAYSAFFVARASGLASEYDPSPYNLSVILEDVFTSYVVDQDTL